MECCCKNLSSMVGELLLENKLSLTDSKCLHDTCAVSHKYCFLFFCTCQKLTGDNNTPFFPCTHYKTKTKHE